MTRPDRGWTLTGGTATALALGVLAAATMGTSTQRALAAAPPTFPGCTPATTLTGQQNVNKSWTTITYDQNGDGVQDALPLPPAALPTATSITSSITLSNVPAGAVVRDVDVSTLINSTASGDLNITISHNGKTVRLVSRRTSRRAWDGNNNLWQGTVWDDQAATPAVHTNHPEAPVATVSPEGKLAAFNGDLATGPWTISVTDSRATYPPDPEPPAPPVMDNPNDNPEDEGTFTSWSLNVTAGLTSTLPATTPAAPAFAEFPSTGDSIAIPDGAGIDVFTPNGSVSKTITVPLAANQKVAGIELETNIDHERHNDLQVSLVNPAGEEVLIAPGVSSRPDFAPLTTWSDDSANVQSQSGDGLPSYQPVTGLSRFIGSNAAGTWRVKVTDGYGDDIGTLNGAKLRLRTTHGCGTVTEPPVTPPADPTPNPNPTPNPTPTPTPNPGTSGNPTVKKLTVGLSARRFSVLPNGRIRTNVRLSTPGLITLQLKKGKKVVKSARVRGKAGLNRVTFRVVGKPGAYTLVVKVTGNGQTVTRTGSVRVRARR